MCSMNLDVKQVKTLIANSTGIDAVAGYGKSTLIVKEACIGDLVIA